MGDSIVWKYCAWLALFSSPAIPLALAWRWLFRGGRSRGFVGTLVPVAVASVSLLWFDAAIANYRFVGSLYGVSHYVITGGNLAAMLLCTLFCLVTSFRSGAKAARVAICLASAVLVIEWTHLGIAYR